MICEAHFAEDAPDSFMVNHGRGRARSRNLYGSQLRDYPGHPGVGGTYLTA